MTDRLASNQANNPALVIQPFAEDALPIPSRPSPLHIYRQIVESAEEGVWLVDRHWKTVYVNRRLAEMFGWPPDAMLGRPITDFMDDEGQKAAHTLIQRREAGIRESHEFRFVRSDGNDLWVFVATNPLVDDHGAFVGGVAMISDITERKQIEDTLRQEESILNEALDIARIGTYVWELDTDALHASSQMYALAGISDDTPADTMTAVLSTLIHPADRNWVMREITAMIEQGRTWPFEFRLVRPDKRTIWLRSGSRLEFDDAGRPIRVIGVHHDITENKRSTALMEARLRMTAYATDHTLRELLGRMLDEAETLTESTIGFFHFVDGDQQALTLQTWSTNTLKNMCAAEGAGLHYAVDEAGLWAESIRQRRPFIVNNIIQTEESKGWPSGHAQVERMMTTPIIRNESIVGVVGVGNRPIDYEDADLNTLTLLADSFWEIVQAKRAEEELLAAHTVLERRVAERTAQLRAANAELEQALRIKDEFLANMSHELRTPLNAIITIAEVLTEQIHGALNPHQMRSADLISESGRHLLDLINAVLDLSKIDAGIFEVALDPVEANSICELCLRFVWETALKKKQRLSFSPAQPAIVLQADARRLKQILINLLANAVKFTPEGGVISLEVQPDPRQQMVRFIVTDNGIGIPAAAHTDIFQPFFQVDSGLARHYEGTGLGLTLVKRLAELHGGYVDVTSAGIPGQGSSFVVTLPWTPTPPLQTASDSHLQVAVTA
jgi:PAS domain S-box-containing protein